MERLLHKGMAASVIILFSLVGLCQQPDSTMIRRIADEILLRSKACDNLKYLTKNIGPRMTGTPAMYRAEHWGMIAMKEAGADTVWKQSCQVTRWIRGGKDEAGIISVQSVPGGPVKSTSGKKLEVVALGNSVGTGPKGIMDNLVLINSFEELEEKKDLVSGKIVFFNQKFNPANVHVFKSYAEMATYRSTGPSRAAKYGALAVMIRSLTQASDNIPHTGSTSYDSTFPKIPAVSIGALDADYLAERLANEKLSVFIRTFGKMLPDTVAHNIIGELRGKEFPGKFITIGAHLDCWDLCEGAHDDGAGCVHVMEVLRCFKAIGYRPRHTIRFVLFANEENGLSGAKKYASEAKAKNEQHIFALESDAGGFTPRGFSLDVSDKEFEKILSWRDLLAPYGGSELIRGGGGADINLLRQQSGTALAGLRPDSQRYFDVHHSRNDVFENVHKRELELGAVVMAALVYLVDKYGL